MKTCRLEGNSIQSRTRRRKCGSRDNPNIYHYLVEIGKTDMEDDLQVKEDDLRFQEDGR